MRTLLDQVSSPVEATVCSRDEQATVAVAVDDIRNNCAQILADQTLDWPSAAALAGPSAQDPLAYFGRS
jgi:hypothetical protein